MKNLLEINYSPKYEESTGDKLLSEMKYHISNPTTIKKEISSMSNVYEYAACLMCMSVQHVQGYPQRMRR